MQPVKKVPDGSQRTTWGGRINGIMAMPKLAYLLSRFDTERPVIDRTGLSGMYDVKLEWTPSKRILNADNATGLPLFTAVEEQLGLKLEARKGPVEVLVVDSAEKIPTKN